MIKDNIITARRVKQNNQEFLVGIFTIKQILTFTKYTERLIVAYDDNNLPVYNNHIQRKVDNTRAEKIADFLIDDPDALFPTNLVLSIPNEAIDYIEDIANNETTVSINEKVFQEINKVDGDVYLTIIDGQHRIRGIEKAISTLRSEISSAAKVISTQANPNVEAVLEKKAAQLQNLLNINLLVTFFIDPVLEFQAMVFSTINRTQKTVPQSLVSSLFGLTEKDTPQKTAVEIVLTLNGYEKSPFFNRIKLHGGTYERNQSPPLTQAAMVKSILNLISLNQREAERDRFREREELLKQGSFEVPFRNYYANNRDEFITDILFSFFTAVKNTFLADGLNLWDFEENTKPKNILHTTVGYTALLNILVDILKREQSDEKRDKIVTYEEYLKKAAHLVFSDQQRYPFTSVSATIFYLDMSLAIWPAQSGKDPRIEKLDLALKKRVS
jgi:DGQHR domain-containing protein